MDVMSWSNLQTFFFFKKAHTYMVSLTTDGVSDFLKYRYLYFGNTLNMYIHCISKRLHQPYLNCQIINLCF